MEYQSGDSINFPINDSLFTGYYSAGTSSMRFCIFLPESMKVGTVASITISRLEVIGNGVDGLATRGTPSVVPYWPQGMLYVTVPISNASELGLVGYHAYICACQCQISFS